jgi:hypothetical protein
MQVAVKTFTIGSIIAIVAGLLGLLIALNVIPFTPVFVGAAIILLALAFFI